MSLKKTTFENAGKALECNEEVSVLTSGRSMQPMLRQHRDVVTLKRVDREFKKGDVVLYPGKDGQYILHRIIRIKKDGFIIRGDNNYFTETHIKKHDIVGILKEFYRDGKYINCDTDCKYKIYSFYICHSYGIRYLWRKIIRPILSKIKHLIFK